MKYRLLCKICGGVLPFTALLALGIWQLARLQEKILIETRMETAVIALPGTDIRSFAYSRVKLLGAFQQPFFRVFAGKNGYYWVQLMLLTDGRYILVNRGTFLGEFFPDDNKEGEVSVRGILYCKLKNTSRWVASNDAQGNLWFWYDIEHMSRTLGKSLQPCIVWGDNTAVFAGLQCNAPLKVRNDHLQYALTWFILAAVWAGGYICFLRGRDKS
ncbi:SURF1 family protein [Anaplasma platys]|uniref:SURF1-like protein n=1 Tax=Anaplasma platys TaxID=949 RepID=A0A858PZ21_9RICK|nr:SURF1 family protein [Anaplasma platys]QJC27863.1 SURF1 family protein [Anaplasma platys]